jgi:hypothetical protein
MCFCIVVPKMVALCVGVADVGLAHADYFVQGGAVAQCCQAQLYPVLPAATADHVVDGGDREVLVGDVAVLHGGVLC